MCYSANYVRTLVQKDIDRAKEDEKKSQKERDEVEKKLKKLKAVLYGKFGNSINL
jgi:predicted translin family RNA/ssDNA-binding protein